MVDMKQITLLAFVPILLMSCIYQRPDMDTDMSVTAPQFQDVESPKVLFDAGHNNFHTIQTTYQPFATLLKNDGILLKEHLGSFTEKSLRNADFLIIANAMLSEDAGDASGSAFKSDEVEVLAEWVRSGGSLLLIADHDPFGSASALLARRFGVDMQSVWTADSLRMNPEIGRSTWLEYSKGNRGLGSHPILRLDDPVSSVSRVITFTGQSLSYDSTWASILQLSGAARNYYERADAKIMSVDTSSYISVPGQSQLIACEYGKGRIVISGEAAMFTAQEVRIIFKTMRAGFNYEGYDNKKFVLNTIHWLLGEI